MALDKDQQAKLTKWLNAKVADKSCRKCGQNSWELGDIVSAPIQTKEGISIGGPSIPTVIVACGNCAFVELYAAAAIGLL